MCSMPLHSFSSQATFWKVFQLLDKPTSMKECFLRKVQYWMRKDGRPPSLSFMPNIGWGPKKRLFYIPSKHSHLMTILNYAVHKLRHLSNVAKSLIKHFQKHRRFSHPDKRVVMNERNPIRLTEEALK